LSHPRVTWDGGRVVQSNGIPGGAIEERQEPRAGGWSIGGAGGPANILSRQSINATGRSSEEKPVYLRDTFGRLPTRFRFAPLFSRTFFARLWVDRFREFGQLLVSFCFFFERLFQ
jgi:hypothetical protein